MGCGMSSLLKSEQRMIRLEEDSSAGRRGSMDNVKALHMPYKLLEEITGGFSDECLLGCGTFGKVYKGKGKDGQEIAVKLLRSLDLDGDAFSREFNNLIKLKHQNIVRLVGFCSEDEEVIKEYEGRPVTAINMHRALCFEYLHNGSLEKHLYEEHQGFDWQKRYTIIKGICMGLKYLHMDLESPVHHLDLKPDNILLDNNMVPKIADFGLSRLLGEETTKKTIHPVGTLGYCPPEFITHQIISKEFDIFSLGVIIIKIICGHAGYSLGHGMRPAKFIRLVHKKWRERLRAIIPEHASLEVDCQQVKKCMEIALKCIDKERQQRPDIGSIIDKLAEIESLKRFSTDMTTGASRSRSISVLPKNLPATFMKEITSDFSSDRELGRSVFGTVYQGMLPEGGMIAVKRLAENAPVPPGIALETEVTNLMALRHDNIVELVGYCHEAQKKVVEHNGRYVIVDMVECCLCYKFLPKGSLDKHLYADSTRSIDWDTRFKIIKGICQGLHFLHKELNGPLVHRNLVPNSIWLDDNWVPKIADFGFSRLFDQEQTRMYTVNSVRGHNGYIAPEYLYRGEISTMSDIYSLGMLILEITTGEKNSSVPEDKSARKFVDNVHQNWRTDEQIIYKYPSLDANGLQQVKACIVIGLKCVEVDRNRRPSIVDIVNKLNGKRVQIFEQISSISLSQTEITTLSDVLLEVYPAQLRFPFKPDKLFSCPLRLKNMTPDYVAARLLTSNPRRYMAKMPLCGVVPPNSTYTLVVTMREQKQPPLNSYGILTLESSIVPKGVSLDNIDLDSVARESGGNKVHKLKVEVVSDSLKEATSDRPFQYEIEVFSYFNIASQVMSVDVHQTEPWILTCHHCGEIFIWDYQEQGIEISFHFTKKPGLLSDITNSIYCNSDPMLLLILFILTPVYSAKFIEREQWLVAGDGDGTIYVYSYDTEEEVTRIEAHGGDITCLAVHPSNPLVISSSYDYLIKLWNWEKRWECARIFAGHSDRVTQVNFNLIDTNSFASASMDCTVKIWNISSSESIITLSGDPDRLLCVQNFYSVHSSAYLVTGSWDGTAQIWDLETKTCVHTLQGHMNRIGCVYRHPELPVLITGSHDGTVRVWSSDTYRLENIIGLNLGAVYAFGYIKSLRRVVVACHEGIAIVEMD